jgi:hypothetical protein
VLILNPLKAYSIRENNPVKGYSTKGHPSRVVLSPSIENNNAEK